MIVVPLHFFWYALIHACIALVCAVDPSAFRVPLGQAPGAAGAPPAVSLDEVLSLALLVALAEVVSLALLVAPVEPEPASDFLLLPPQAVSRVAPAIAMAMADVAMRPRAGLCTDLSPLSMMFTALTLEDLSVRLRC